MKGIYTIHANYLMEVMLKKVFMIEADAIKVGRHASQKPIKPSTLRRVIRDQWCIRFG
jgi:hypothetical protein